MTNDPINDVETITELAENGSSVTAWTRRGLIAGVAAAGAGAAAGLVLGAQPAGAANGADITVGGSFTGTAATQVLNSDGTGFYGLYSGASGLIDTGLEASLAGVVGDSSEGWGVVGISSATNYAGVCGATLANGADGVFGSDQSTTGGYGVHGNSYHGIGVRGDADENTGVYGTNTPSGLLGSQVAGVVGDSFDNTGTIGLSLSGIGVYGITAAASGLLAGDTAGVIGDASSTFGVIGLTSGAGYAGVYGVSSADGADGVYGFDHSSGGGRGMVGQSTNGVGVLGNAGTGIGVNGWSVNESGLLGSQVAGVVGDSDTNVGVIGLSSSASGVMGITSLNGAGGVAGTDQSTGGGYGVTGISSSGSGVYGLATGSGAGLLGASDGGYGVTASGGLAPLLLVPTGSVGAPTAGAHVIGELSTDKNGTLFSCIAAGTPGTWKQVALAGPTAFGQGAFCLLSAPIRLLDTRHGSNAPTSPGFPVAGGGKIAVPITAQSVGGIEIPPGAVAVIGNVTAVNALAHGYLTLWPTGVTQPATSSINFPATTSIANGVTVALSTGGEMNIFASQTTDVIFDATGFIA